MDYERLSSVRQPMASVTLRDFVWIRMLIQWI